MPISFSGIPASIRTPGVYAEFDSTKAVQGTPTRPLKALLIGLRLSTGSVAAETPTLVPSTDAAETYFGRGSVLANMCRAFKDANRHTELYAIALNEDSGGTAGTKTLTVTGPATADGVIYLYIEGKRTTIAVANGDAQDAIASAIKTAIDAMQTASGPALTATAGVATNVVTLTSRHKGTLGHTIDVRLNYNQGEFLPAGVSIAIATGVSGATDPDIGDAVSAMADEQYDTIATAWSNDTVMDALESELEDRWGPTVQKEGHLFAAIADTLANSSTAGNARNSPFATLWDIGGTTNPSPTPTWVAAAAVAAVDAARTDADVNRPRHGMAVPGVLAPALSDRRPREDRNTLLTDGVATSYVDSAGVVRIDRLITTYQSNALGTPDTAYLDVTTPRNLGYLRYSWKSLIERKYPDYKLAADGTNFGAGQAVVTPGIIRGEALAWFKAMELEGRVENFDQFAEDLVVERNVNDPERLDMILPPDLVNGFSILAARFQFIL